MAQTITFVVLTDKDYEKICKACPYMVELNSKKLCYRDDYYECRHKNCKIFNKETK